MIVPNKAISYETSLLSKLPVLLRILEEEQLSPVNLYYKVRNEFIDINQFLLAIDTLFVLEKVVIENGELKLC